MSCKIGDKRKEMLIKETISKVTDIMSEDECFQILKLGLSWVVDGDRPMVVTVGWSIMDHLKQVQRNVVKDLMNFETLEELLTVKTPFKNKAEVPSLIIWYLSLISCTDEEERVSWYITDYLRDNVNGNMAVLVNTSKLVCQHSRCIPKGPGRIRFCEVVIVNIAGLPMPKAQHAQIGQLINQMKDVEKMLTKVWNEEPKKSTEDLLFKCLAVLHSVLINSAKEPCSALAAILQLIDSSLITKAVQAILRTKQGLARTLRTLCDWLICWPGAGRLNPWVNAMMDGLEAERQYAVLMEVTLATVDRLFQALQLPVLRPGIMQIVWRMLASSRHTPQVFLKVMNKIPKVIAQLLIDKSKSSNECLQMVVSMCFAMMNAYPRDDNIYDPVVQALKDCTAFLPPSYFADENVPNWCEGLEQELLGTQYRSTSIGSTTSKEFISSYSSNELDVEYIENQERSSTNRVGLNNLGNTCYMNSVLQALYMTQRFCAAVLESDAQSHPLLGELQSLFALLLLTRRCSISPINFLAIVRPPNFEPGHQQDSSEFLTYLLDVIHEQEKCPTAPADTRTVGGAGDDKMETEVCGAMTRWTTEEDLSNQNILQRKARSLADFTQASGEEVKNLNSSHSNSTDSGIQSVCGEESTSPVPYESLVQQAFGGQLLTSFKCLQCEAESVHTDHFRDIQLAFPPGSSPQQEFHIQELLDYFLSPEHLSGENQYRCDSCGGLRDAQRSIRILQFPSHLVLTLKRFQYNSKTRRRAKLLHTVECSENIELQQQPYRLYAAIVHSGASVNTGHYYTIARDQGTLWHIF
ncbi:hypothetical protein L9F63_003932 [Diploptera punctata]|uniref:USP domain-containing protein n=1 Tax=Diploptera punctata TaxID=6984 RepID=A0AAD8E7V1_DIPPU|nr:hypothetical protein L9F63_003932 [Diploptera punctata]